MQVSNPYLQYQQNAVLTAGQEKLTLMLYQGALRFTRQAAAYMLENNTQETHNVLVRTQDIMLYLISTLNSGVEVADSLGRLYDFIYAQLVEANFKKDPAILEGAERLLQELAETWVEAMQKNSGKAGDSQ